MCAVWKNHSLAFWCQGPLCIPCSPSLGLLRTLLNDGFILPALSPNPSKAETMSGPPELLLVTMLRDGVWHVRD